MQDYRRYAANIIRQDAQTLFGSLFRMYMEKAGLTQLELEEKSIALRDSWVSEGFFDKDDSGDLTQSSISKVMGGQWRRPSYGQIFIWLYVIEEELKAKGDALPKDIKDDMFRLMCYVPPEIIIEAYKRLKPLDPKLAPKKRKRKEK